MPRTTLVAGVVAICAFLLPVAGPASSPAPKFATTFPSSPPHVGIVDRDRGQGVFHSWLVRIDPATLRERPGRRLALGKKGLEAWSFSRDRGRLAFTTVDIEDPVSNPTVLVVDARELRVLSRVRVEKRAWEGGWVRATGWLPGGRLVALVQVYQPDTRTDVVTIDPVRGAVVRRVELPGQVLRIARTRDRLLTLLTPQASMEPARLAIVGPGGTTRTVVIPRIRAGYDERADGAHVQQEPGLAVDPEGQRAFVVPANGPVAEVALAASAISYHRVARRLSFVGRLRSWLEPVASAKTPREGSARSARWLGNGLIGVTGGDYAVTGRGARATTRFTAAGLHVIDTADWSVRKLGKTTDTFWPAGNLVLATAAVGDGYELDVPQPPPGLIVYGADGRERLRLYEGKRVWMVHATADRVFAGTKGGVDVVDLRSGRAIERRSSVPYPLVPPGPANEG